MKSFLRSFFASLLAFTLLLVVVLVVLAARFSQQSDIAKHSYLHVDLYGEVLAYDPPGGVLGEITGGSALTLQMILENLDKAAVDKRIDGVILQMSSSHTMGPGKLQEIREAVKRVQAAGKPVYGYADSMDKGTYFLAAACDSLYCPPSAYISFMGFHRMTTHLKEALAKLGIEPHLDAIRHYKAAAQLLTRTDLSPEAHRNADWLLGDLWDGYCAALTADRGLTEERVTELMQHALFTAEEAVAAGLFDRLLYWDELDALLKQDKDDHLKLVSHGRYADEKPEDLGLKGDDKIAVIHAQGNIGGRENGVHPLLGLMMGHETIVGELMRAKDDEDVVAIVLRVDSGGGDSLTSDIIGHAVAHVRESKPVIVSMVDVAASGGYMVSYHATKIMANPATVTGSIGSISGKFSLAGFYEKIGVTTDHISVGPNARMMAQDAGFTAAEAARFSDNHWQDFRRWMNDVAKERGIAATEIDSLCMGRTWTGRQAVANGLVDQLGGQHEAVELAKAEAGLDAEDKVTLWHLPVKQGFIATLLGAEDAAAATVTWSVYRRARREAAVTLDYLTESRFHRVEPSLTW